MKLNNKGFLISGILYSLLLLFLVLIIGMTAILSARQNKISYITRDVKSKLNDKYESKISKVWTFEYTGDYQVFTVPTDGYYRVELWGAQGGDIVEGASRTLPNTYGRGAYTKGIIYLNKGENIYIYVGQNINEYGENLNYAYNGGGRGESIGGGATDIRLVSGAWDNFESLKSRIMVAAGGGGAAYIYNITQSITRGDGGAYNGISANFVADRGEGFSGHGATQTSGGQPGENFLGAIDTNYETTMTGTFGKGGYSIDKRGQYLYMSSGGGGGYFGGGHGNHPGNTWTGGGGGSSFISGLYGCEAIDESSVDGGITFRGSPNHYSGKVFTNAIMIAGDSEMPSHEGSSTIIGNSGNGYAKISLMQKFDENDINKQNIGYSPNGLLVLYDGKTEPISGIWKDLTENGNNGILNNFEGTNYHDGNSIKFDGVDDYISVDAKSQFPTGNSQYTMEIVFYIETPKSRNSLVNLGIYNSSGNSNGLGVYGTYGIRHYYWGNDLDTSYDVLNNVKKYTVTALYNGEQRKIYIDGVEVASDSATPNVTLGDITIGKNIPGQTGWEFNGKIYSVRIYNRGLTQSEIKDNNYIDKFRFGI